MADNDDYMGAKTTGDTITELMWDKLQEGINANRRFRLKGVAGGNNMRYSSTKVVWDSDIYIYFTRESDGAWVYNKVNTNPTTGIICGDDDLLYIVLNDTTATVLTVTAADYTSMPTDDTGRILILGAVRGSRWYGISSTDISHDSILNVSEDDHHAKNHDNTEHTTNYETANANIQTHVASPGEDVHHAKNHNNTEHTTNYEAANANIQAHVGSPPADSHHTKYALLDDLIANEITVIKAIDDASINNTKWDYIAALTEGPQVHMSAANPHSGSGDMDDLIDDTTPQLGGELDFYNKRISLNATAVSDNNATGIIINMTAGGTVAFPNLVYVDPDGNAYVADADSNITMPAIGIALESKTVGQTVKVLVFGFVYRSAWAWAVGGGGETRLLYASTTPGGMTQTPPSGTGDQVQVVGIAVTPDCIEVNMGGYVLAEVPA